MCLSFVHMWLKKYFTILPKNHQAVYKIAMEKNLHLPKILHQVEIFIGLLLSLWPTFLYY